MVHMKRNLELKALDPDTAVGTRPMNGYCLTLQAQLQVLCWDSHSGAGEEEADFKARSMGTRVRS